MFEIITNAWKTVNQQSKRFIWIYIFGLVNGFMAFYLFKTNVLESSSNWFITGAAATGIGQVLTYTMVTNIAYLLSLLLSYRVMSYQIGVKLTKWRFVKMQTPALFSALLLSFTLVGMIVSFSTALIEYKLEDNLILMIILVTLSFSTVMFYFLFTILYLKRYKHYDEGEIPILSQFDYIKAFWVVLKETPNAFLYFVPCTLVLASMKYISVILNIKYFSGLGVFIDGLSVPVMLFILLLYICALDSKKLSGK